MLISLVVQATSAMSMNLSFAGAVPIQFLLFSIAIHWLNPTIMDPPIPIGFGVSGLVICTVSLIAYHLRKERGPAKPLQFAIDESGEARYMDMMSGGGGLRGTNERVQPLSVN